MEDPKQRSMFLLNVAKSGLQLAEEAWARELHSCFPVGATVRVKRSAVAGWRIGKVDMHGYNGDFRVLVENGTHFWIRHNNHWGQVELA